MSAHGFTLTKPGDILERLAAVTVLLPLQLSTSTLGSQLKADRQVYAAQLAAGSHAPTSPSDQRRRSVPCVKVTLHTHSHFAPVCSTQQVHAGKPPQGRPGPSDLRQRLRSTSLGHDAAGRHVGARIAAAGARGGRGLAGPSGAAGCALAGQRARPAAAAVAGRAVVEAAAALGGRAASLACML